MGKQGGENAMKLIEKAKIGFMDAILKN